MRSIPPALMVVWMVVAASGCSTREVQAPAMTTGAWEALPLGTNADFRDIWFSDSQHGWIVGGSYQVAGGLVGRTQDGGRTWRFSSDLLGTPDGPGRISMLAVRFFDAQRGIVATSSGPILSTTDGGENWALVSRLTRGDAVSNFFFLDEQRGWAAGGRGVFRTDNAGQQWSPVSVDETGSVSGRAVAFVDDRVGWLAGMHASLMRSADGGMTWESPAIPLPAGERPSFWDVCFVDTEFGWVVGEEGTILATRNGGSSWTLQSTGVSDAHSAPKLERIPRAGGNVEVIDAGDRTPGLTLRAVRFVNRYRGWVVGHYANFGRSLILRTEDGGATWAVDADIAGEELNTLFVQGREQLWAVGARTREGAQVIYRRPLSAAGATGK